MQPIPMHSLVIAPLKGEYELQSLVAELWARKFPDAIVQEYGRRGQRQNGVDVFVINEEQGVRIGLQCKAATNSDSEFTEDDVKAAAEEAKAFQPPLKTFIIVTTRKRDAHVQDAANALTVENQNVGSFSVTVMSWEELTSELSYYPDVAQKYLSYLDWQAVTPEQRAQLDYAATLLDDYKPTEALALLDGFKRRFGATAEPKITARILTLQALANFVLGRHADGVQLIMEAYDIERGNIDRLCNYAHALAMSGKATEALSICEKVIAEDPNRAQTYAIAADIWLEQTTLEDIISRIPADLYSERCIAWKVGELAKLHGNDEISIQWLERAVENDKKNNPELRASLAQVYFRSVVQDRGFSVGEMPKENDARRLERAEVLCNQAIERVTDPSLATLRSQWLYLRSLIRSIIRRPKDSLSDIDECLRIDPSNNSFLLHRAKLALLDGLGDAKEFLDRIIEHHDDDSDWALLSSETLKHQGEVAKAIEILKMYLLTAKDGAIKQNAVRLLIGLHIEAGDVSEAAHIAEQHRLVESTLILDYVARAEIARAKGLLSDATKLLTEAQTEVNDSSSYQEITLLADLAYFLKAYQQAAQLYSRIATRSAEDSATRKLIYCLLDQLVVGAKFRHFETPIFAIQDHKLSGCTAVTLEYDSRIHADGFDS